MEKTREFSRTLVIERLKWESLADLTFDFDPSVRSTKEHAELVVVDLNIGKKGALSYYPYFPEIITS